jgi:hypothetical protein
VLEHRARLLCDALVIWRWGRQSRLAHGKPLGNFEQWALWCRDPLLALGCRDPVDRIAQIKVADPRRAALVNFFETWWQIHATALVKASEAGDAINELADQKSARKADGTLIYNRQRVASFLDRHANTRVGGFAFSQITDGKPSKPTYYYKLTHEDASYKPGGQHEKQ